MGWGTTIKPEIYLNRITKDEVDTKLEDVKEDLELCKMRLLCMIAKGASNKVDGDLTIVPEDYLPQEFREMWNDLAENIRLQYRLELAKEYASTAEES